MTHSATWCARVGTGINTPATPLQHEGAKLFVGSWKDLMNCIASRSEAQR